MTARVRRWGHSLGIILPKMLVQNQKLQEGAKVEVMVRAADTTTVKDLMDFARERGPARKIDTESVLAEVDRDFWGTTE